VSNPTLDQSIWFASIFRRDPDFNWRSEFAWRRLTHNHSFRSNPFTALKIETGPWLGHTSKGHFLDRLAGFRIHDRRGNAHNAAIPKGMNYWKLPQAHLATRPARLKAIANLAYPRIRSSALISGENDER
jgi:hypothetical protein